MSSPVCIFNVRNKDVVVVVVVVTLHFFGGEGGVGEVFLGSSRRGARSGSPNLDTIAAQYL